MTTLLDFPITRKWPPAHPERLQLYSLTTPNGVKASIMLEETGLPYEAHRVSFDTQDQMSPEFLSLNPNNKIPALIDPNGPGGKPLALWESGAILIYLAEKTGQLLPQDPAARYQTLQWLMWQMGGVGDDYSIADIAVFPWVRNLVGFYAAGDLVQFGRFKEVQRVLDAFVARPAVQRGLAIPAAP
jgi:GST-like protein